MNVTYQRNHQKYRGSILRFTAKYKKAQLTKSLHFFLGFPEILELAYPKTNEF